MGALSLPFVLPHTCRYPPPYYHYSLHLPALCGLSLLTSLEPRSGFLTTCLLPHATVTVARLPFLCLDTTSCRRLHVLPADARRHRMHTSSFLWNASSPYRAFTSFTTLPPHHTISCTPPSPGYTFIPVRWNFLHCLLWVYVLLSWFHRHFAATCTVSPPARRHSLFSALGLAILCSLPLFAAGCVFASRHAAPRRRHFVFMRVSATGSFWFLDTLLDSAHYLLAARLRACAYCAHLLLWHGTGRFARGFSYYLVLPPRITLARLFTCLPPPAAFSRSGSSPSLRQHSLRTPLLTADADLPFV